MPSAALRIYDLTESTSASVERLPELVVRAPQSDRMPSARLDRIFATARDARKAGAFDRSEEALASALKIVSRDLEQSQNLAERPALAKRKAETCFALAQHRMERANITGAETLLRKGIDAFSPDMASGRWPLSRRAGEILRNYAGLLGNAAAAGLAASIVDEAAEDLLGDVDAQNQIGLSYALLGELTSSAGPIEDAVAAYERALAATNELAPGDVAFRHRIQINRAEALWQLAKLQKGEHRAVLLQQARSLLEETINAIPAGPFGQEDRSRALDNLGLVLSEQGQWTDAIAKFESAAEGWNDDNERRRTLNNLTTTLRLLAAERFKAGQSSEAWAAINKAVQVSDRVCGTSVKAGLQWGYTQHNRGLVLLLAAMRLQQDDRSDEARGRYQEAHTAFSAAQQERKREWAPPLWATSTVALGDTDYQRGRLDGDPYRILLGHEHYDAVLTFPDTFLFERLDVEERRNRSLKDCKSFLESSRKETNNLPTHDIDFSVNRLDHAAAHLAEVFNSSDLSEAEAKMVVAEAYKLRGWSERTAAVHSSPVAEIKPTGAELVQPMGSPPLPELPAGLEWPKETYSGSPESKRDGGGIVAYLDRVWRPIHEKAPGTIDLRSLRAIDASAAMGVNNLKRTGKKLPEYMDFPTLSEINDRLLTSNPAALLRDAKLAQVVANRVRRGSRVP